MVELEYHILDLSNEILQLIQLHLSPRHVSKLFLANKYLYKLLANNEQYWERVVAHRIWRWHFLPTSRNCSLNPNTSTYTIGDRQVTCLSTWYDMMNLEEGYYQAMNGFLALIPLTMSLDTIKNKDGKDVAYEMQPYAHLSLAVQIRYLLSSPLDFTQCGGKFTNSDTPINEMSIKDIYKVLVENWKRIYWEDQNQYNKLWKWVVNLEDMPDIPITTKRMLVRGLMEALNPSEAIGSRSFFFTSPLQLDSVLCVLQPLAQ
jgi:hypothetical protein